MIRDNAKTAHGPSWILGVHSTFQTLQMSQGKYFTPSASPFPFLVLWIQLDSILYFESSESVLYVHCQETKTKKSKVLIQTLKIMNKC
jgi:hypothetical protein